MSDSILFLTGYMGCGRIWVRFFTNGNHLLRPCWQVCEILEPLASLECLEGSFFAPEISDLVSTKMSLRIMTWNACAISFPLQIHPLKFLLGLFLGRWWHDACYDAPMEINNGSAQLRYARQADYIRHAGADLAFQNLLHHNLFEKQVNTHTHTHTHSLSLQLNVNPGFINTC